MMSTAQKALLVIKKQRGKMGSGGGLIIEFPNTKTKQK